MEMTIDEAIKHCEEVAYTCEFEASKYDMTDAYESHVACQEGECANEHRQLAEWLKDYKRLKEQEPRWIPVSEELPKVADCYVVTRQIGSDLIVDACFFDGTNTWHNDNRINHERNYLTNIVAWMPSPAPFEPQELDGNINE